MVTIGISEARQTLPAQLDRVEAGEEIAITRHGRVIAVIVRPDVLAAKRASAAWGRADRIGELLARAREEPIAAARISAERVDELVADVRAARYSR